MWTPEQCAVLEATATDASTARGSEQLAHPIWDKVRTLGPEAAWQSVSHLYPFKTLPLHRFLKSPTKASSDVRFVCISDTHGQHEELDLPAGDVLVHTGDFTRTGRLEEVRQFSEWLAAQPHARKIIIAGNHDLTLHAASYERTSSSWGVEGRVKDRAAECADAAALIASIPGCEYLCDSGTVVQGLRVWGSPWQPVFAGAFNLQRGPQIREKWRLIPSETDVLLTHGPPLGQGDLTSSRKRAGCLDLLEEVTQRVRPLVHCFGHIHEGHGVTTDGTSIFVNASSCTRRCGIGYQPLVFDLPSREGGDGGRSEAADDRVRKALIIQSEKAAIEAYFSSKRASGGDADGDDDTDDDDNEFFESVRQERLRRFARDSQ